MSTDSRIAPPRRPAAAPTAAFVAGGALAATACASLLTAALPADQAGLALAGWEVGLLGAWVTAAGAGYAWGANRVIRRAETLRRSVRRVALGAVGRGVLAWLLLASLLLLLAPALDVLGARLAAGTSLEGVRAGLTSGLVATIGAGLSTLAGALHGRAAGRRLTRGGAPLAG
jgi:hypothetical protein